MPCAGSCLLQDQFVNYYENVSTSLLTLVIILLRCKNMVNNNVAIHLLKCYIFDLMHLYICKNNTLSTKLFDKVVGN